MAILQALVSQLNLSGCYRWQTLMSQKEPREVINFQKMWKKDMRIGMPKNGGAIKKQKSEGLPPSTVQVKLKPKSRWGHTIAPLTFCVISPKPDRI